MVGGNFISVLKIIFGAEILQDESKRQMSEDALYLCHRFWRLFVLKFSGAFTVPSIINADILKRYSNFKL